MSIALLLVIGYLYTSLIIEVDERQQERVALSEKHCQKIENRFQYGKCKTDFLGDK